MKKGLYLCLTLAAILSGCMNTREIQTSSPRVFSAPESPYGAALGMSLLSVEMTTGETLLPVDIQALRFRIEEVRLRSRAGEWQVFPSELNIFEIVPGRSSSRTILTTRVLPADYDSLEVKIRDVFVLFGENAGGLLTLPRDGAMGRSLDVRAGLDAPTQLRVVFEPGASLARDPDCRWHFVPFWTVEVE